MKVLISSLLFLMSLAAYADESLINAYAELVGSDEVTFNPTYFFRAHSDGDLIGYNDEDSRGQLYSFKSKKLYPIGVGFDRAWDPVFIPNLDVSILAVNDNGIIFFDTSELDTRGAVQFFQDDTFRGIYHSIGVLETTEQETKIRVIIQSFRGMKFNIRDYAMKRQNGQWSVTILNDARPACNNQEFSMAFLSRDGKEIIASDMTTQKSTIYKIQGNGSCTADESLEFLAGKGSFSYDGKLVAFHNVSTAQYNEDGFLKSPTEDAHGNIMIFDRSSKKVLPLTNYEKGSALYPDFIKDGTLRYVVYPEANGGKVRYVHVRLNKLN